jgi:hypothetical protein
LSPRHIDGPARNECPHAHTHTQTPPCGGRGAGAPPSSSTPAAGGGHQPPCLRLMWQPQAPAAPPGHHHQHTTCIMWQNSSSGSSIWFDTPTHSHPVCGHGARLGTRAADGGLMRARARLSAPFPTRQSPRAHARARDERPWEGARTRAHSSQAGGHTLSYLSPATKPSP